MSQSATGGVAFIQLISANRITSLDSVNSKEFPFNHLSCCRKLRRFLRLITRACLFYASKRRSGVRVKAYIRHLRVKIQRVKYWEIAHDLSATCARILLPFLNGLTKPNTQQTHAKLCIYLELLSSNYLWVAVLRQHLQHRRFSALNVSNKNQFASHHQRLRISSFLHDFFFVGPLSFPIPQKISPQTSSGGKKTDACVLDGRAPGWMRAVDLIEFATAALYTSEGQPMRAHTFHRLPLLHPATTTARLVCRQQDRRIDASASSHREDITASKSR